MNTINIFLKRDRADAVKESLNTYFSKYCTLGEEEPDGFMRLAFKEVDSYLLLKLFHAGVIAGIQTSLEEQKKSRL